jgi:hypothetical protein
MNSLPSSRVSVSCPNVDGLLARSLFYREIFAKRQEIMRHKWIESEKAGRDIGFDQALVSWLVHHRANWRRARQQSAANSQGMATS